MFEEIKRHCKVSLFKHTPTGIIFTEFRGSFSWPRGKDAFVAVVGEQAESAKLHLVYEGREKSILNLARRLMTMQRLCRIGWIADVEAKNKALNDTLYEITYSEENDEQVVYPTQTQLIQEDFDTALQILGREFQENNLFLIKDKILFNILKEIQQKDTTEPGMAEKYPEIMVLANIVYDFPPHEQRLEQYLPRDPYPEFFDEDDEIYDWMAL
jgi:hypothetical protein